MQTTMRNSVMTDKINKIVSIIVPVYNQEKYIKKSLDSIVQQTYSDIEVVIVNDGSTDNSNRIISEYTQKDSRVVVINKPNGGLVDAVSVGIANASGEYLAFVDPDDYVGKDYIADLVKMVDDGTDMVASGIYTTEIEKGNIESVNSVRLETDAVYVDDSLEALREDFFLFTVPDTVN